MLDTLYKIGQQLSQNADREEFDNAIVILPATKILTAQKNYDAG